MSNRRRLKPPRPQHPVSAQLAALGGGPRPGQLTYIDWSYVAGYPSTLLAAAETSPVQGGEPSSV